MQKRLLALVLVAAACATSDRIPLRQDAPDEAAEYAALKRAGSADPAASLEAARSAMSAMPRYATEADEVVQPGVAAESAAPRPFTTWKWLGPGNIGGRTRTLIIDPDDPSVMYAGGVSGGIWKSETAGAEWRPVADHLVNIAVNSMAMDPRDSRVLYAGTGEGYFREEVRETSLPLRGEGIFVTRDAGESWEQLPSTRTPDFQWVNDLVVSEHDSSRLYAATRTGVWRSKDAGATWTNILATTVKGGCLDLATRPDPSGDWLLASCGTLAKATVWRSTDASRDEAWTAVLTAPDMGRTTLAIAPSDPTVIYALAASVQTGGLHAVYRSTSSGDPGSWVVRTEGKNGTEYSGYLLHNLFAQWAVVCGAATATTTTMGWYCNTIAVDPTDSSRVFLGSVDLFRSDDGGASWGIASYWWPAPGVAAYLHADQHAIVFPPGYDGTTNRSLYLGNDGGIYRTDDALAATATGFHAPCNSALSAMRFTPLNNNLGITQFYHGAVSPDGRTFVGGTQDNGTVIGSIEGGPQTWRSALGGDGTYVAFDWSDPNILYAQTQYGRVFRSSNGGATFKPAVTGLTDDFPFVTPLAIDPNFAQRLWLGGTSIWRTDNGTGKWTMASAKLPGRISAIAVAPANSDRVITGTSTGTIARTAAATSSTGTTIWAQVRPREGFVSSVAFDPSDTSVVYATYAGFGGAHVWKSPDGGATWQAIDGTGSAKVPDIPVHSIAVDPTRPQRLYLGTDLGVFVSLDGGGSWAVENTGFATAVTESIVIGQGSLGPAIYAFTHGRGVWRAELTVRGPKRRAVR
jgi:hypothetical protein